MNFINRERSTAMKDKDASSTSILSLSKYMKNSSAQSEEELKQAADALQHARARSREALMLDVHLRDGTIESFDYSLPKRVTYAPEGTLILRFGGDRITVQGSNLERVRQAVTEGRARSILEGTEAEQDAAPDDAAHIERIVIAEGDHEA
jgi:hypothetical protein